MEIKEAYKLLELEVGATREAVEAAYLRLIERWHPDRAGGPAAAAEAQRMVQTLNEAYQKVAKIAPPAVPASADPGKPRLAPATPPQPAAVRAAPPPASAPVPTPPPAAAPAPEPTAPVAPPAEPKPTFGQKLRAAYDLLFPVDSPRRRYGLLVVAGVALVLLLVAKMAISAALAKTPEEIKVAREKHVAETTGILVVKSNLAQVAIKAVLADDPNATVHETPPNQPLRGLAPGRYLVTAGQGVWTEKKTEAVVQVGQTTTVTLDFAGGSLRLDSTPSGAEVSLAGNVLGVTPLHVPLMPVGDYPLSIKYQAWPPVTQQVSITADTETRASVRLPQGKVYLDSYPSGATVLQGRTVVGTTPLTIERAPTGSIKFTLRSKEFPPLDLVVTVADGEEVKLRPNLGSVYPELDPAELLRDVWIPEDRGKVSTDFNPTNSIYRPRNDIVKNLRRDSLYNRWLRKFYRFSGTIKTYDPASGRIEFAEDKSALSRYRVLAQVRPSSDPAATPLKAGNLSIYGRLVAVEEPSWPSRTITLELVDGGVLPETKP